MQNKKEQNSLKEQDNAMYLKQKPRARYVSASTEPVGKDYVLDYVQDLVDAGTDFIHCDVMDGLAVEKETYDEKLIGIMKRKFPKARLDVHLMTEGGSESVKKFVKYKPYAITVQYDFFETEKDLIKALKMIKSHKIKAGISLSPNVPLSYLAPYISYIDIVLIMGVKPGLGGQTLIPETILKVKEANNLKRTLKNGLIISFDGGVNFKNASKIFEAGADVVVSGNAIYNSFDREYAIQALKSVGEPIVY